MIRRIALVSETEFVPFGELARVSAAVQKQVSDDFGPVWGVSATVDPFAALADIPLGYWPVVVRDDIGLNVAGVHTADEQDRPFALVTFVEDDWPLSISHEVLEMLSDPWGKEYLTGPSLLPNQGTVEYLVEVCDPCQSAECAYAVNGVLLSDFVLPAFYKAFGAGRYSFAGHVTAPRAVLPGGYVTWRDPLTAEWAQYLVDAESAEFRALGTNPAPAGVQLRGFLDRATAAYRAARARGPERAAPNVSAPTPADLCSKYPARVAAEGDRWRARIDRCRKGTD